MIRHDTIQNDCRDDVVTMSSLFFVALKKYNTLNVLKMFRIKRYEKHS